MGAAKPRPFQMHPHPHPSGSLTLRSTGHPGWLLSGSQPAWQSDHHQVTCLSHIWGNFRTQSKKPRPFPQSPGKMSGPWTAPNLSGCCSLVFFIKSTWYPETHPSDCSPQGKCRLAETQLIVAQPVSRQREPSTPQCSNGAPSQGAGFKECSPTPGDSMGQ